MDGYKPRIIDRVLETKLQTKGAIFLEGAKWCGKTTTAEHFAKSVLYMNEPKNKQRNLALADIDPSVLLEGDAPRLIDEWQLAPSLWDAARFEVDHRRQFGQFIFTGSSTPMDTDQISHSGTGRFAWLKMRPMSLMESGESNGSVKLGYLFASQMKNGASSKLSLRDIAFLVCRGGWPLATFLEGSAALSQASDYYDAVVSHDLTTIYHERRGAEFIKSLMRSYARNQGSQAGEQTIARDVFKTDELPSNNITVHNYLETLRRMFVIEDVPAWNPNLRSKTAIRSSDTRYFVDPSIAVASLGLGPDDLMNDLNTFGLLFETLCIRDLRIYAEALGGSVYHYRDKTGLECDAVIHLRNGQYGLIEIKLGGEKAIAEGAGTLKRLSDSIDVSKMKVPSFQMVLTANSDFAYQRSDGVYVVPIGTLGV